MGVAPAALLPGATGGLILLAPAHRSLLPAALPVIFRFTRVGSAAGYRLVVRGPDGTVLLEAFLASRDRLVRGTAFLAKVTGAVESFGAASLCGGRRFEPGQTLPLVVGTSLDLVVTGFGVDNADRVEAVSLPGVNVQLSGRRSFPVPQLTLALKIDAKAPVGKGELRLRYPVEVAGHDRILVEVLTPASAPCQTPSPSPKRPRR